MQGSQLQLGMRAPFAAQPEPHEDGAVQTAAARCYISSNRKSIFILSSISSSSSRQHPHPPQPHQMWRLQHVEATGEGAHAAPNLKEGCHDAGKGADAHGPGPGSEWC